MDGREDYAKHCRKIVSACSLDSGFPFCNQERRYVGSSWRGVQGKGAGIGAETLLRVRGGRAL